MESQCSGELHEAVGTTQLKGSVDYDGGVRLEVNGALAAIHA